jgi:hypothetical protein
MVAQALEHVVKICLVKDPQAHWQTTHDVLLQSPKQTHAGRNCARIRWRRYQLEYAGFKECRLRPSVISYEAQNDVAERLPLFESVCADTNIKWS